MKRVLLTVFLALSIIDVEAQRINVREMKYLDNFELSVGAGSFVNIIGGLSIALNSLNFNIDQEPTYSTSKDYHSIPAINLSYGRQINPLINLGVIANYSHVSSDITLNSTGRKAGYSFFGSYAIIPTVRFDWLRFELVRCYSSAGLGIGNYVDSKVYYNPSEHAEHGYRDAIILPHCDFVPFGIAVGRNFYGFAEVSVGTIGFCKFGGGVRF